MPVAALPNAEETNEKNDAATCDASCGDSCIRYCHARILYEQWRFDEACKEFRSLYAKTDKPAPTLLVALGQCAKHFGQFANASYFYSNALVAYSMQRDVDDRQRAWHSQCVTELRDILPRLAILRISLEELGTVRDVRVDNRAANHLPEPVRRAVIDGFGSNRNDVEDKLLKALANSLLEGAESTPIAPATLSRELTIVLDRTQEHTIQFTQMVNGEPRKSRVTVRKDQLAALESRIDVVGQDAVVTCNVTGVAASAEVMLVPTNDAGRGFSLPLWPGRENRVPAGTYLITVKTSGTVVTSVRPRQSLTLRSAGVEDVKIDLKPRPPLYERLEFWGAVGTGIAALVAGTLIVCRDYNYCTKQEHRTPINAGTLGWIVTVTK
jgi:hypothetical protein